MGTADLHQVPVRMPMRKLPHLLRSLHPGLREVRMSQEYGVTRTGYRYGNLTVEQIVREARGAFTQQCQHDGCWLIVQGGDQAMTDHIRTVHKDDGPHAG